MNHIYETDTGKLVSSTSLNVNDLKEGHSLKSSNKIGTWNTTSLDFDPLPETKVIPVIEFFRRFTNEELEEILHISKTNNKVGVFIKKLELMQSIDLLSTAAISSIDGIVELGLITSDRAVEVLS